MTSGELVEGSAEFVPVFPLVLGTRSSTAEVSFRYGATSPSSCKSLKKKSKTVDIPQVQFP